MSAPVYRHSCLGSHLGHGCPNPLPDPCARQRYFIRAQPGLLPFLPSIFRAIEGEHRTGKISFKQFLKVVPWVVVV